MDVVYTIRLVVMELMPDIFAVCMKLIEFRKVVYFLLCHKTVELELLCCHQHVNI